jgi:hypothetical protein
MFGGASGRGRGGKGAPLQGPAASLRAVGGKGVLSQSQPLSAATRAASTRVRAPVLPIAEDR